MSCPVQGTPAAGPPSCTSARLFVSQRLDRVHSQRRPSPDITLTPLIDILFIVLIFLALTATFRESTALRLTLPEARTGEIESQYDNSLTGCFTAPLPPTVTK